MRTRAQDKKLAALSAPVGANTSANAHSRKESSQSETPITRTQTSPERSPSPRRLRSSSLPATHQSLQPQQSAMAKTTVHRPATPDAHVHGNRRVKKSRRLTLRHSIVDLPTPPTTVPRNERTFQSSPPVMASTIEGSIDVPSVEDTVSQVNQSISNGVSHGEQLAETSAHAHDLACEAVVTSYQQLLAERNTQLADLQSLLQTYQTELPVLGFTEAGATPESVFAAIRTAFRTTRTEITEIIPSADLSQRDNGELLKWLVEFIRSQKTQVDSELLVVNGLKVEQAQLLEDVELLQDDNGILQDKLAEVQERFMHLDTEGDSMRRDMLALQEVYDALQKMSTARSHQLDEQAERIEQMEDLLEEDVTTMRRLETEREQFRRELLNEQGNLVNLQKQHEEEQFALRDSHTNAVNALQTALDEETKLNRATEIQLVDKTIICNGLSNDLEEALLEVTELRGQLADLREELVSQSTTLESTEIDNEQKALFIVGLEKSIAELEERVNALEDDLGGVRAQRDDQALEREAAESALAAADLKVEELTVQKTAAEKTGNELRMQLFVAQQNHKEEVASLQDLAEEKDSEYQEAMEQEVSRREEAERNLKDNEAYVNQLQVRIEDVQSTAVELETAKNDLLNERANVINQLKREVADLQQSFDIFKDSTAAEIATLRSDVATLKVTVEEREIAVAQLETDNQALLTQMENEVAQRDDQITDLRDDLELSIRQLTTLKKDKASLEIRIEDQALEMLSYSSRMDEELSILRASVNEKNTVINDLTDEAVQTAEENANVLVIKDKEIQRLITEHEVIEKTTQTLANDNMVLRQALETQIALRKEHVVEADLVATAALNVSTALDLELTAAVRDELEASSESPTRQVKLVGINGHHRVDSAAGSKRAHSVAFPHQQPVVEEVAIDFGQGDIDEVEFASPQTRSNAGRKAKKPKGFRDSGFSERGVEADIGFSG